MTAELEEMDLAWGVAQRAAQDSSNGGRLSKPYVPSGMKKNLYRLNIVAAFSFKTDLFYSIIKYSLYGAVGLQGHKL